MNTDRVIGSSMVIVIAIIVLIGIADPFAKFIGGPICLFIGVMLLVSNLKGMKNDVDKEEYKPKWI